MLWRRCGCGSIVRRKIGRRDYLQKRIVVATTTRRRRGGDGGLFLRHGQRSSLSVAAVIVRSGLPLAWIACLYETTIELMK